METKFIEVSPSFVDSTIDRFQAFGWQLMGQPQSIYNKSSHLEERWDGIYNVTETTDIVRITFQRDQSMPNYDKLCEFEKRYADYEAKYIDSASKINSGDYWGDVLENLVSMKKLYDRTMERVVDQAKEFQEKEKSKALAEEAKKSSPSTLHHETAYAASMFSKLKNLMDTKAKGY